LTAKNFTILIRADSRLVIEQLNGQCACQSESLKTHHAKAQQLMRLTQARVEWIPREQNQEADGLSRKAYLEVRRARAASQRKAVQ
jgi:ribonuclease HI